MAIHFICVQRKWVERQGVPSNVPFGYKFLMHVEYQMEQFCNDILDVKFCISKYIV